jgi:hypothetical protein
MKLIIEIDVDGSDFEEGDVDVLIKESQNDRSSIGVEIGTPVEGEEGVFRFCRVSTSYYTIRKEGAVK